MHKNKVLIMITCAFLSAFFFLTPVLADCNSCTTSNCSACGCVLNEAKTACVYSNYTKDSVKCGSLDKIPATLPKVTKTIVNIVQVAVPILLVVFGMIDLIKSIVAQKEDEIKKGKQILIKRLITAVLIFFVFVLVKFFVSVLADGNTADIIECAECFIEGKCK